MTQNTFENFFTHGVIVCLGLVLCLSSGCENSGAQGGPVPYAGYAGPYTDDEVFGADSFDEDYEGQGFDDDVVVPSRPRPQVDSWQIRTMKENIEDAKERIAEYRREIDNLPPDAFLDKLHYLELIRDYENMIAFGIGKLNEWGVDYP